MPDASSNSAPAEPIDSWLKLWNGDFSVADALISSDFRWHAVMADGSDSSSRAGPAALVGWIGQTRAAVPDLRFTIQVGPIAAGDQIAVRWRAEGTYAGGFPGAAAPAGTPVAFTGTDMLRVRDGRLAEYWVNSDMHVLFAQLQVSQP